MIRINSENDIDYDLKFSHDTLEKICESVLINEGCKDGEVTFVFTNDEFLRCLKNKFFNQDVYTDVITFNLEEKGEPLDGEIYISWDRVKENSSLLNVDIDEELKRIIIHSSLHLVGYEDGSESGKNKMNELENKYLYLNSHTLIQ